MTNERTMKQLIALSALQRLPTLQTGDRTSVFTQVCETVAQVLEIERVGVWSLDSGRGTLSALNVYERSLQRHLKAVALAGPTCVRYCRALGAGEPLVIHAARTDPRSSDLWDGYLLPARIEAILDIPVNLDPANMTVLRCEHVGSPRVWTLDEQLFATAVAGLLRPLCVGSPSPLSRSAALSSAPPAESEHKYQRLLDSLDGIVWEADPDAFRFTFVSRQAGRVLGYPSEQWVDQPTFWHDRMYAADRDTAYATRKKAIQERRNQECEYRITAADGRLVWLQDVVTVVLDEGRPVLLRGVMLDITKRKELEEQLRQSQKMEAVGKLAGGIAHDFNNLLTVITGYSELILKRLRDDDPMRRRVEEIKKAGDRAATLTQQLLAFSRRQVLMPKVLDCNGIISSMETMLQRLIGEDINLVTVLEPSIGSVKADPGQLEQVLMNLVVNARDAMPRGGRLTVETSNVEFREAFRRGEVAVASGRYMMVAVSDTGIGMDADTQARIFDPFFTTKGPGKGTGLGLATAYGIVKQSGGYIFVHSEVGRGSTFKIYLPRVDASADTVEVAKPAQELPRGSETILLVEDEPGVRELVRDALRLHGYTVLEARHGIEALLVGNQHPGTIHLLITDVVMPQMSGREVADCLRPIRPGIKVLYMSGYTENAVIHHGVLDPGTSFLQKPFTPDTLLQKVGDVLLGQKVG